MGGGSPCSDAKTPEQRHSSMCRYSSPGARGRAPGAKGNAALADFLKPLDLS